MVINGKNWNGAEYIVTGSNDDKVHPEQKSEVVQYLGIFYATKNQDKDTYNIIKREISAIVDAIKRKWISDLIAAYIVKKVLLPRIEYRMQNTFLTDQ